MRGALLFILILLAPSPLAAFEDNLTHAFAIARAAQISNPAYELRFQFEREGDAVKGQAIVRFELTETTADVFLDYAGRSVSNLRINNTPVAEVDYQPAVARLRLPTAHLVKGANVVELTFESAYSNNGAGLHHFIDAEDGREYLYTDLQPNSAHRVFPCFDQPDLRASFELELTLPSDWEVSANGSLLRVVRVGEHNRMTFAVTKPIATYLFNMVLGQYAAFEDGSKPVPQRLLVRQSLARYVNYELIFATTRQGLAFFEDYFQEPYPFGKYDQSFVPEYNAGAMENPASVVLNENLILGFAPDPGDIVFRDQVLYHELAHMWFGNLVTMRWWDDLWLNESFASYMEIIALRGLGNDQAWRIAMREKIRAYEADLSRNTRAVITAAPDIKTASSLFDGIVYNKGMAVLRQLDYYLGEDLFRDGIREYLNRHAWGNTELTDLVGSLEAVAKRDLDPWFKTWLKTAGLNGVHVEWRKRLGRIRRPFVVQTAGNGGEIHRPHAMALGLFYLDDKGKAVLDESFMVRYEGAKTQLPMLKGRKAPVFILPNLKGYDFVDVSLDPISLKWLEQNLALVSEAGHRTQILELLWRMVGRGEFSANSYFELALAECRDTDSYDTALRLSGYLDKIAAEYTVDPTRSKGLGDRLFELSKAKLSVRVDGQDPWLMWLDLLCETAVTEAHLEFLDKLLSGDESFKYYPIEIEDKWRIASTLIEHNHPQAKARFEAVCAESSPGILDEYRASVEALFPQPKAKAKVWQDIHKGDLSLERRRQLMQAFHSRWSPQLSQPYIQAYFDNLMEIYRTEDWVYTRAYGYMLFPKYGGSQAREAAQTFLKQGDLPIAVRKMVLTGLDDLEKAQRIRRAD